jgi:hypothetical protein
VLEHDGWKKHRVLPRGIHVYDLVKFNNQWFAALGTDGVRPSILLSDDGQIWKPVTSVAERAYELFEFQGKLYAMHWLYTDKEPGSSGLYIYNGSLFLKVGVAGQKLFPGTPHNIALRMTRITLFGSQLVYIGARFSNDHQTIPLINGLFVATKLSEVRKIMLPFENTQPFDILMRDDTLYVLVTRKKATGYINAVFQTQNLETWTELFRFSTETFVRSLELHEGDFYFGLGSNPDAISEATGNILKIARSSYQ